MLQVVKLSADFERLTIQYTVEMAARPEITAPTALPASMPSGPAICDPRRAKGIVPNVALPQLKYKESLGYPRLLNAALARNCAATNIQLNAINLEKYRIISEVRPPTLKSATTS